MTNMYDFLSILNQVPQQSRDNFVELENAQAQNPVTNIVNPMPPPLAKIVMEQRTKTTNREPQASRYEQLQDAYMKSQNEALENQRTGVSKLEKEFESMRGKKPHMAADIIMGLSDVIGNTNNLSQSIAQRKAEEAKLLGFSEKIQDAKNDLSSQELGLQKLGLNAELDREKMKQAEMLKRLLVSSKEELADKNIANRNDDSGKDILKTKESQKIQAQINLANGLKQYEDLIDKHGYSFKGKSADTLDSAYADLKIKYKEAANLGALTGPDVTLLMEAIKPATGFGGGVREAGALVGISGGTAGAKSGIGQVRKLLTDDYYTTLDALEGAFGPHKIMDDYRNKFNNSNKTAEQRRYEELMRKAEK